MRATILVATLVVAWLGASAARASDPSGIYARIDKVEVGPTEDKPEWIKVYGDFLLVKTSGRIPETVRRGYMYFSLVPEKAELCRLEWNDLKKLAGTDKNYIAFGSAHTERRDDLANGDGPNVHTAADRSAKPIPYPLNHGLNRLRTDNPEESKSPVVPLQKYLKENPLSVKRP